ncbi:MAG TPA: hypothetical protein DCY75_05810 [Clostridiales bacterium]|nr:hypothetical protein [Clostridiales bacterium]
MPQGKSRTEHKTKLSIVSAGLLLVILLSMFSGFLTVYAEENKEKIVYVSSADIEGERNGSRENPYADLYSAFLALSNCPDSESSSVSRTKSGGTIVILDSVVAASALSASLTISLPEHANPITIMGEEGAELVFEGKSYFCTLLLGGKTTFDTITLRTETNCTIDANENSLTFTENFKTNLEQGSLYVYGSNYGVTRVYGGTFSSIWATEPEGCIPNEETGVKPADAILLFGRNAVVNGMIFGAGITNSFTGKVLLILEGGVAGHVYGGSQNIPFHGDTQIWITGNVTATISGNGTGKSGTVKGKKRVYEMASYLYPNYVILDYDVLLSAKETTVEQDVSKDGTFLKAFELYIPQPKTEAAEGGKEMENVMESVVYALPAVYGDDVKLYRLEKDGLHNVLYDQVCGYYTFRALPGTYVFLETGTSTGLEHVISNVDVVDDQRTPGEIITKSTKTNSPVGTDSKKENTTSVWEVVLITLLLLVTLVVAMGLCIFMYETIRRKKLVKKSHVKEKN